ncbi:MAG TPA: response regulator transcription factor [Acidimicrobiales bacterium]|nr:response regulator transcription factor [Acidimicrobiales bacterium]
MTTILIIDDEPGVRDLLQDALGNAGYHVECATNGADGLDQLRRRTADLCIVDINMPTMNGFEFLEKLRAHDAKTPVLMLTARDSGDDVERGLRVGADDYVRKPFSLEELLLRVAAILRRTGIDENDDHVLTCGPLVMNIDRHVVTLDANEIELSATEFRLLEVLLEQQDRVVTREQLLRQVWNIDFDSETSVLDTYISYVRRKVHHDDFAPITTIRGVGFKLMDPAARK